MSLVIALVCGLDSVFVYSDGRRRSIKPIYFTLPDGDELNLAITGGVGDSILVKQSFKVIESMFKTWFKSVGLKERRNPYSEEFEDIISGIESQLIARYKELREDGVESDVSLLVASVTNDGIPKLYVFDNRGLAEPVHENPGYALLGRGATAGNLILRLLDYNPIKALRWSPVVLATFIIDMISEVDPAVSQFLGQSCLITYYKSEGRVVIGALSEEGYKMEKEKAQRRREWIKLLWDLLEIFGDKGEKKFERKLKRVVKQIASSDSEDSSQGS